MLRRVLWSAVLLGAALVFGEMPRVSACSCSGAPVLAVEFQGEALDSPGPATLGRLWRFRATAAAKGVNSGDVVEVAIDGQDESTDGMGVSSCALGGYPAAGGVYKVGAYEGANPDGSPRLFANSCGGYVQEVNPPANDNTDVAVGDVAQGEDGAAATPSFAWPQLWPILAAVMVIIVGVIGWRRLVR